MLTLYGTPSSNYYNIAKIVLLEKGIEFNTEFVSGEQTKTEEYLKISPAGKIPALDTGNGYLTETNVILSYLDEVGEGPSFFPADPFKKAKVKELMKCLELYIELPARHLYPDVFFNTSTSEQNRNETKKLLKRGFTIIKSLIKMDPYIAGSEMTYADLYAQFSLSLAIRVAKVAFNWDAWNEVPGYKKLFEKLSQRESYKKVAADHQAAFATLSEGPIPPYLLEAEK